MRLLAKLSDIFAAVAFAESAEFGSALEIAAEDGAEDTSGNGDECLSLC